MAEAKKLSIVKKKWCAILAPKSFNERQIGETYVANSEQIVGKSIVVNLANLTNDIKKQNISIKFEVTSVKEGKASTAIMGYMIVPAHVKRLTRRSRSRVDISFICNTSDGKSVRIKPLILTLRTIKRSASSALKKICIGTLTEEAKKVNYENLIDIVVSYKLQSILKDKLKKITPLKSVEIKEIKLLRGAEAAAAAKKLKPQAVKEEEPAPEKEAAETQEEAVEEITKETDEKQQGTSEEQAEETEEEQPAEGERIEEEPSEQEENF